MKDSHMVETHIGKSNERSGLMESFHAAMPYKVLCTHNSYYTCGMQPSQNFSWLEAKSNRHELTILTYKTTKK